VATHNLEVQRQVAEDAVKLITEKNASPEIKALILSGIKQFSPELAEATASSKTNIPELLTNIRNGAYDSGISNMQVDVAAVDRLRNSGQATKTTVMGEEIKPTKSYADTEPGRLSDRGTIERWNNDQVANTNNEKSAQLAAQLKEMQVAGLIPKEAIPNIGSTTLAEHERQSANTRVVLQDSHATWHDEHPNDAHPAGHGNNLVLEQDAGHSR
jgi:hypothetical protein